ncbi:MAG: metallophosphoesterase [Pseudomonadota bacterium]
MIRSCGAVLLLALAFAASGWEQNGSNRFSGAARVVVFGDVHGAFEEMQRILRKVAVIDASDRWIAGDTHLVSIGDLLGRGDESRAAMDLLMRLQREAEAAGGRVHVVLGNHEVMNLTGDLAYVTKGEFASYIDVAPDPADSEHPPGFAGHRQALSAEGPYGRWLLGLPFAVVINDVLYLHAGVGKVIAGLSLEQLNERAHAELRQLMAARETLRAGGAITRGNDNGDVYEIATRLSEDAATPEELRTAAGAFLKAIDGLPFDPRGPAWNRRNATCHPFYNQAVVAQALGDLGAERLVIGHTPTSGRTIQSRFDGQVVLIDTGMNVAHYKGRPSALEFVGDVERVHYTDLDLTTVQPQTQRTWNRPYGMSDAEIERFLAEAEVVQIEDLPIGVTKPQRLTLRQGDREMRAVFKTYDSNPDVAPGRWSRKLEDSDRYLYDLAAYRLDRLLGFEMVPPAVIREVNGRSGLAQYWLEGAINDKDRRDQSIPYRGVCGQADQYNLMNVFDALIYNVDRNLSNVLYTRSDWRVWLIDHTRAFRASARIPRYLRESPWAFTPEIVAMLERINLELLAPLEDIISDRQLRGIERRAKALLKLAEG